MEEEEEAKDMTKMETHIIITILMGKVGRPPITTLAVGERKKISSK
jgi:hypothetical protein